MATVATHVDIDLDGPIVRLTAYTPGPRAAAVEGAQLVMAADDFLAFALRVAQAAARIVASRIAGKT